MKLLRCLDKYFEEVLMAVLLSLIVIVMALQVFMRYLMGHALSFPEEFCRYSFIWLSFIGISYSIRCRNSLKIDILETILPKFKPLINAFGNIILLLFVIAMIWKGTGDIGNMMARNQVSPALGIPMWGVYMSFLVGCWMTSLRIVQNFILDFLKSRKDKELRNTETGKGKK